jgi:GTP-binding protein HflX
MIAPPRLPHARERAYLVGILPPGADARRTDALEELRQLAETAGAEIAGGTIQKIARPHAATFVGTGKAAEIAERSRASNAHIVLFDANLSPAQGRNLERIIGRRVVDRTQLILHIFAMHARTAQAKLQVELAQLEYQMPRLRRLWTHLGQQAGGTSADGGPGIGQRGPGERQLEVDRRLARDRITQLRREIAALQARRERLVAARAADHYTVALVGYTNAGKSTLMRTLTGADVLVEDRLFSTLDTRTRLWRLPSGLRVLVSDTVGFIRNLPHTLVASFHATLEEVAQADLLLHVVDASSPHRAEQVEAVRAVLGEIGCGTKETILVLNKVDRLRDRLELDLLRRDHPEAVPISALGGVGIEELAARVEEFFLRRLEDIEIVVAASDGARLAEIHRYGVVTSKDYDGDMVRVRLRAPRGVLDRLRVRANGQP